MIIAFASTTLAPDFRQTLGRLTSEGLAWFLSLSPEGAITVMYLVIFALVSSAFLATESMLVWAYQGRRSAST